MPQDRLTQPVTPIGHHTVEQACEYMLGLTEKDALLTHWQQAARLGVLARRRASPRAIAEFTDQFELALMLSRHFDPSAEKRRPVPSVEAAHRRAAQPERRRRQR
jgi:hypothetical protein